MYSDPEVRRFFPEGTLAREETREEMEWHFDGHPVHPGLGLWAALLRENGRMIGRGGLLPWSIDGRDEVEIAYLIEKASWGQGLTRSRKQVRAFVAGLPRCDKNAVPLWPILGNLPAERASCSSLPILRRKDQRAQLTLRVSP